MGRGVLGECKEESRGGRNFGREADREKTRPQEKEA
jgi:hypothetical protein